MIIISRFLCGAFVGAEFTLAPAYFGQSYSEYVAASKQLGKKQENRVKAKDVLNAAHSISMALGTAVGTGKRPEWAGWDLAAMDNLDFVYCAIV